MEKKNIDNMDNYTILEKVSVEFEDTNQIRSINLDDYIHPSDSVQGYYSLRGYDIYFVPKSSGSGSCDSREYTREFQHLIGDEGEHTSIVVKSLKSKDDNCAFAMFTNQLKLKINANNLREKLGIELHTPINMNEQLDKLIDHFECDVKLYMDVESGFRIVKQTNKFDKCIEIFLNENHYFLVKRHTMNVICPQCGKERANKHKCAFDDIHINNIKQIAGDKEILSWDDNFKNVVDAINTGMNILISGEEELVNHTCCKNF